MSLREQAIEYLRKVLSKEKQDDKWSILKQVFTPKSDSLICDNATSSPENRLSIYESFGGENIGSLLSTSWDRYCDYEIMAEYPDISTPGYFANDVTKEVKDNVETLFNKIDIHKEIEHVVALLDNRDEYDPLVKVTMTPRSCPPPSSDDEEPYFLDDNAVEELLKDFDDEPKKAPGTNQTGTTIGRFDSSKPNLSNQPREKKFVPTKEDCGCSGKDLLFSGHKCGFFKND